MGELVIKPWSSEDREFLLKVKEPTMGDPLDLVSRGLSKADIEAFYDDLSGRVVRNTPFDPQIYIAKLLALPVE